MYRTPTHHSVLVFGKGFPCSCVHQQLHLVCNVALLGWSPPRLLCWLHVCDMVPLCTCCVVMHVCLVLHLRLHDFD